MVAERVILSYDGALVPTIIRPATVCGPSPRMRLDLTVNLLTLQALTNGVVTVLGGSQIRPNIHIDDLVDVYLFALDHRLAGIYNAGFENLSILEIARAVAARVRAEIQIRPSTDPRSYRQCSDRLLAAGFTPARTVSTAIEELAVLHAAGRLRDDPSSHNVSWMRERQLA
jgi:nucleoside-diphosphate-sugar epimerase